MSPTFKSSGKCVTKSKSPLKKAGSIDPVSTTTIGDSVLVTNFPIFHIDNADPTTAAKIMMSLIYFFAYAKVDSSLPINLLN